MLALAEVLVIHQKPIGVLLVDLKLKGIHRSRGGIVVAVMVSLPLWALVLYLIFTR